MTPEKWQQVKELFEVASERSPADRAAFLAHASRGDQEVMQEVESLLAAHDGDPGFMNSAVGNLLLVTEPLLKAGQCFGQYKAISLLGEGGMGEVYLAVDARLGRKVALKLLPSSSTGDAERVRRFGLEARAASALNHPNIVTIHEIGQADSLHFIATEFVEGGTLREHLLNTRMTVGEVLDVAAQVASALQAAHEAGIVHRDVKPENIMLRRDGFVKVLDFGLAKLAAQQVGTVDAEAPTELRVKTNPGVVMGTAAYMSPEQARGAEVDARTDIWSLGVVLYEMVAGRAPFRGETPSHVIVSILESEPPALAHAEVPVDLERMIAKALSKNRQERYRTAGDLALALKNLKEELTVESRLKQFRRSDADDRETPSKRDGRVGLETTIASVTSPASVTITRLTSSAEYLVNGIKHHRGGAIFASTTAFFLVALLVYFSNFTRGGGEAIDSVAVLHFVTESGDPEAEYLSDGISDSVISSLSRLPNLKVISFSTASRYKGKQIDPQAVGRELNVQAVLVGRMTRRGNTVAISTELVDVTDNRRLWGANYDGNISDILAMQKEIAGEIVAGLRLRLGGPERQLLTKQGTESTEAYDAYLRGRYLLEKQTGPATEKSIEYFERAIKLDPHYALAYATLSYAYFSVGGGGVWPKAKAAVSKALEIDDTLAEAHTALGHIRAMEWDWTGAERAFKRATELNPNSGFAHSNYAFYFIAMRRFDEAVAESKRAVELEPTSILYNRNLALNLYFARRYDEAIEQSRKTLELDPLMPTAYAWLAKSYQQKGLYDQSVEAYIRDAPLASLGPEAAAALKDAYATSGWQGFWRKALDFRMEQAKQGNEVSYQFAEIYAQLGEKDQTFACLEKGYEQRNRTIKFIVADPLWDDLRSDPRYADLVRRMGLEP